MTEKEYKFKISADLPTGTGDTTEKDIITVSATSSEKAYIKAEEECFKRFSKFFDYHNHKVERI